jgi:hypothetical protein
MLSGYASLCKVLELEIAGRMTTCTVLTRSSRSSFLQFRLNMQHASAEPCRSGPLRRAVCAFVWELFRCHCVSSDTILFQGALTVRPLSTRLLQPFILALYTRAGDHRHLADCPTNSGPHRFRGMVYAAADVHQSGLRSRPAVCPPVLQPGRFVEDGLYLLGRGGAGTIAGSMS